MFRRNQITRQLLPRGCSIIELTRCTEGLNQNLSLSSTSPWYHLKSNSTVLYTQGIVFVELDDISLPISLTGTDLLKKNDDFSLTAGPLKYIADDGILISNRSGNDCWSFDVTPLDIHDFLTSDSFLNSFFVNIQTILPDWLSFSHSDSSFLQDVDLKTELLHGYDVATDPWCNGAPVIPTHLYSILRYNGSMSVSIYWDRVQLSEPLAGERFCFIVDVCQATIFLMLPEQSRDLLDKFEMFKHLKNRYNIGIRPRGIGLSLGRHINVHSNTTELQLWNGDRLFKYP